MSTLRLVTKQFDNEFRKWLERTKKYNGFPPYTDSGGKHRTTRRVLMDVLGKHIQDAPPIKIKRIKRKRYKYEGELKKSKYRGIL